MELIKGQSAPEVWLAAVEHLAGSPGAEDFDVFLNVAQPTVLSTQDKAVYDEVDAFLKAHGAFSLHTVAETIFPLDEYLHGGAQGVFKDYPTKIRTIQRARDDGNWGTYAFRFLRQRDFAGEAFNPLEDMVDKIKKHGKYRASFELGQGRPFEDEIPIYDPATDRKRLYGGPCLSHLSIKVHDGRVRFNATYRSHYYVRRLLGNLVGLGRLQYFLARETKLEVGGLTINSTFARLDTGLGDSSGIQQAQTLRVVYELLRHYPGIGPFLAFQYTIDLNYSELLTHDESDFVVAGPGALDGIAKCFVDTEGRSPEEVIYWVYEQQEVALEAAGIASVSIRAASAADRLPKPLLRNFQIRPCRISRRGRTIWPQANQAGLSSGP